MSEQKKNATVNHGETKSGQGNEYDLGKGVLLQQTPNGYNTLWSHARRLTIICLVVSVLYTIISGWINYKTKSAVGVTSETIGTVTLFDGAAVLCSGNPAEGYCDCEGDCTGLPHLCACAEAQACCENAPPVVLCPDQPQENYCDCNGDCTEKPEWCQCSDAQACCNGNGDIDAFYAQDSNDGEYSDSDSSDESSDYCDCDCDGDCTERPEWCQCADAKECCENREAFDNKWEPSDDSAILCPGQQKENYCDCDGDCTEKPEWCQCSDAKECCENREAFDNKWEPSDDGAILCPGQPKANYCDCDGDCTEKSEWCQCSDAKECCK